MTTSLTASSLAPGSRSRTHSQIHAVFFKTCFQPAVPTGLLEIARAVDLTTSTTMTTSLTASSLAPGRRISRTRSQIAVFSTRSVRYHISKRSCTQQGDGVPHGVNVQMTNHVVVVVPVNYR